MKEMQKLIVVVFLFVAGCASKNHTAVVLRYNKETKQLTVGRTESARNFSKLKTEIYGDTMKLNVYDKPFYLTFSKKKKGLDINLDIPDSVNFVRYGIHVYSLKDLQTRHGKYASPAGEIHGR